MAQPAIAASTPRDTRSEEFNGRVSAVPLPVDLDGSQTEYGAFDGAGGETEESIPEVQKESARQDVKGSRVVERIKRVEATRKLRECSLGRRVKSSPVVEKGEGEAVSNNHAAQKDEVAKEAAMIQKAKPDVGSASTSRSWKSLSDSTRKVKQDKRKEVKEPAVGDNDRVPEAPKSTSVDDKANIGARKDHSVATSSKGKCKMISPTECSGCCETFGQEDILRLSCPSEDAIKHAYCHHCIRIIFQQAIADSHYFPPSCCEPLQLSHCAEFLTEDLVSKFQYKKEELETPDRTYCSHADCGKWIRPENIEAGVALCPACAQKTCTICKAQQHEGLCPEDGNVKALMKLAEKRRWKSCPKCKNMIELNTGCYHMT